MSNVFFFFQARFAAGQLQIVIFAYLRMDIRLFCTIYFSCFTHPTVTHRFFLSAYAFYFVIIHGTALKGSISELRGIF